VDGALIGGASLKADQFIAIVEAGTSAWHTEEESASEPTHNPELEPKQS
jgi:hypothetical protein